MLLYLQLTCMKGLQQTEEETLRVIEILGDLPPDLMVSDELITIKLSIKEVKEILGA